MYDLGFFDVAGRFVGRCLDADPPRGHLLGPLAVHLEIIASCNLACSHCFATPLPRRGRLTLREIDALFAELAAIGSYRIGLTGGEVLMRPDLFDIVDAALDRGLHPCLTTNGLLIDERIARELGRRPFVWLNVSLEGATAERNDASGGPAPSIASAIASRCCANTRGSPSPSPSPPTTTPRPSRPRRWRGDSAPTPRSSAPCTRSDRPAIAPS